MPNGRTAGRMRVLLPTACLSVSLVPLPHAPPAPPPPPLVLDAPRLSARFGAWGAEVRPAGPAALPPSWHWRCRLDRWGRPGAMREAEPVNPQGDGAAVVFHRTGLVERWEQRPEGIEHTYDIEAPPPGAGPILLEAVSCGLAARPEGNGLLLGTPLGPVLAYGALRVTDATGRRLPAGFAVEGERLIIRVEAEGAYPIRVDPLVTAVAAARDPADQADAHFGAALAAGATQISGTWVAVGAPDFDAEAADDGRLYVFRSDPSGLPSDPLAFLDPAEQAGARFGTSAVLADINGDGTLDLAVGAPDFDAVATDEGRVYVYVATPAGLPSVHTLALDPADQAGARFGAALAAADVTGDQIADLVVSAPGYDAEAADEGRVYVFTAFVPGPAGVTAALLQTLDPTDQPGARFGEALALGDFDGDGRSDLAVGAPFFDGVGADEGRVFLFATDPVSGFLAPSGFLDAGDQPGAHFGFALAAGHVTGDAFADLAVGSPDEDAEAAEEGAVRLFAGAAAGLAAPPLSFLHPTDFPGARFGGAISLGDAHGDGDGLADLAVGAPGFGAEAPGEGRVFLYQGNGVGVLQPPVLAADPTDQAAAGFGSAVLLADASADPDADLLVGAPGFGAAPAGEGRVVVLLSNRPPALPSSLAQLFSDGATPIPAGGTTAETAVLFRAIVNDVNAVDVIKLQVEVQPVGDPFAGTPSGESSFASPGATVTVAVPVSVSNFYRWRARTVDARGAASAWVGFNGDDDAVDFVRTEAPDPPAGLTQFQGNGVVPVPAGGADTSNILHLGGTVTDADPADTVGIEAEVRPIGTVFSGVPTGEGAREANGGAARLAHAPLPEGRYHWQARAKDDKGAVSAWVSFGGNAESEADVMLELGSQGHSRSAPCFAGLAGEAGVSGRSRLFRALAGTLLLTVFWMGLRSGPRPRPRVGRRRGVWPYAPTGVALPPPRERMPVSRWKRRLAHAWGALACLAAATLARAQLALGEVEGPAPGAGKDPAPRPDANPDPYPHEPAFPVKPLRGPPARPAPEPRPFGDDLLFAGKPRNDPLATGRNNVWHTIVNVPPLEAARLVSEGGWEIRSGMDIDDSRFERFAEGGDNRFDGSIVEMGLQVDHGIAEGHQVGARATFGEVLDRRDRIYVWDDGQPATASGTRSWGVGGFTLRHKWLGPLARDSRAGVRTEVKLPAGDRANLLTGRTVDVAVSGVYSRKMAGWVLHANAGGVVPIGGPGLFTRDDRLRPFVTGGIGAAVPVAEGFTLLAQFEGNGSAFGNLGAIHDAVGTVTFGLRARLFDIGCLTLGLGKGFTGPLSTAFHRSIGIELVF